MTTLAPSRLLLLWKRAFCQAAQSFTDAGASPVTLTGMLAILTDRMINPGIMLTARKNNMSKDKSNPIPPEGGRDTFTRERMQQIARMIDEELPQGWGFFLMAFPFNHEPGRMNYVSNAKRETVHELMREFLGKGGATFEHK